MPIFQSATVQSRRHKIARVPTYTDSLKIETHHISMTQHKKCSYCDVKFRVDNTNQSGQNRQPVLRVPTYHDCSCFSRDAIKILKLVDDSRRLIGDCRKLCYISRFCRDKSVGDGLVGICRQAFRICSYVIIVNRRWPWLSQIQLGVLTPSWQVL